MYHRRIEKMKNKDKRKIAIQIISLMEYGKLYTAKQLAHQSKVSLTWQKHLSAMEMSAFLREQRCRGTVEYTVIRGKGYWKKIKPIQFISAT